MLLIYFLLGIVFIIIGIASIVVPEDMIYMQNFLRFRNFEPTDGYILWTRISGGFMIIAGIAMAIIAFVIF